MRLKAIRSLGKIKARSAALLIVSSLDHAQPNVRKEAAAALGEIRAPETRPHLEAAADDPDADVRKNVRWALQQLDRAISQ